MYSFPSLKSVHCFMSSCNCCYLTCIQISQEAGKVFLYSHLLKNLPQFVVIHTGFPGGSAGKESTFNVGDLGSIPGLGRSPGEGNSFPLRYSGLENPMDCIVPGIAKSQTRLSDFYIHSLSTMWQYLSKCKIHKTFDQKFHF